MIGIISRVCRVLGQIVPIILSFLRDFKRYLFWGSGRELSERQHQERARNLTERLQYLGPTFIKLAQVLSSRADVLPPVYLQALSTLQDRVNPEPTAKIERVIDEELRHPIETLFETFETAPLAAASLGQVHRARYRGEDVVVKVLRPGVRHLVLIDLKVLFAVLKVLNAFFGASQFLRSLTIVITEFRRVILEEMDFELEARNVKLFRRNLQKVDGVHIPKVYDALSTKRVIVLEYLQGTKINQVAELEQMGADIELVLRRLMKVYLHQILVDGVLHADPHPGNILVDSANHLIILDFGMVVRIDEDFKRHLIKFAMALVRNDIDGMVSELYELRLVEPGTNKALLRDLALLMLELQAQGKISAQKVQQMLDTLMNVFYEFPFTLPSELVYTARAVSLIEGIGFIHDPWFDMAAVGRPIIKGMISDVLQDESDDDLLKTLQKWALRSYQAVTALQDSIIKLDREQLRVHLHPLDLQQINQIIGRSTRLILGGFLALMYCLVCCAIYLRTGNWTMLASGVALVTLAVFVFLLYPQKLPQSAQHRLLQQPLKMFTAADGEVYKSIVVRQMSPEERKQAEMDKQTSGKKTEKNS